MALKHDFSLSILHYFFAKKKLGDVLRRTRENFVSEAEKLLGKSKKKYISQAEGCLLCSRSGSGRDGF